MSTEYKILYLFFKKNCTYYEISVILDVPMLYASKIVAVELCEIKRQEMDLISFEENKTENGCKVTLK
jgi:hypothetical protein